VRRARLAAVDVSRCRRVGTIGIVDNDRVDITNLQRQIVHATGSVGELKVESAVETLARINDG